MREITPHGWSVIESGMRGAPTGNLNTFWEWSMQQGDGYKLAAYFLIGFSGGSEGEGFPGFNQVRDDAHPVRVAWALDSHVRGMLAEFIKNPSACMR